MDTTWHSHILVLTNSRSDMKLRLSAIRPYMNTSICGLIFAMSVCIGAAMINYAFAYQYSSCVQGIVACHQYQIPINQSATSNCINMLKHNYTNAVQMCHRGVPPNGTNYQEAGTVDNVTGPHHYGNYTTFSPMSECFTYHVDNFTFYGKCLE